MRDTVEKLTIADYEQAFRDHQRLVREIDVIVNGEAGAAKQASLCDLVPQLRELVELQVRRTPLDNDAERLTAEYALLRAALAEIWDYSAYDWAKPQSIQAALVHAKEVARTAFKLTERVKYHACEERTDNDNFHTSIYEDHYKGLLVARCNQNGRYPLQAPAIIRGLEANNVASSE